MIKIVTSEEMRLLDKMTIEQLGIPGMVLMENAGRSVYQRVEEILKEDYTKSVILLAGRGNNGGDAFVAGRQLFNRGYKVFIFFVGNRDKLLGDALENFLIAEKIGIPIKEILTDEDLSFLITELERAEILVDGLLGTGIKGGARGLIAKVIDLANGSGKPIIAIDTPSGLDCTFGKVEGPCIKATETVTFGLPKRGMFIFPGGRYVGRLVIADISIPCSYWKENDKIFVYLITQDLIREHLPNRELDYHKGQCGRVFVLAGSPGYTGAAVLSSESALRAGAGLVTLGIPSSLNPILEVKLTEVMTKLLPETEASTISLNALDDIMKMPFNAIAIGPGLSQNQETAELIRKLIACVRVPMVIDADGLNALCGDLSVLSSASSPVILTPHPGEMSRLVSKSMEEIKAAPVEIAREFASEWKVWLILKFANSIIASPDGKIYFNPTGNPGMATGGCGDVLTGIVTSFLAQGISPLYSCLMGTFIHGLCGDLAVKEKGEESLIAGDLIDYISESFKKLRAPHGGNLIEWIVEI